MSENCAEIVVFCTFFVYNWNKVTDLCNIFCFQNRIESRHSETVSGHSKLSHSHSNKTVEKTIVSNVDKSAKTSLSVSHMSKPHDKMSEKAKPKICAKKNDIASGLKTKALDGFVIPKITSICNLFIC